MLLTDYNIKLFTKALKLVPRFIKKRKKIPDLYVIIHTLLMNAK